MTSVHRCDKFLKVNKNISFFTRRFTLNIILIFFGWWNWPDCKLRKSVRSLIVQRHVPHHTWIIGSWFLVEWWCARRYTLSQWVPFRGWCFPPLSLFPQSDQNKDAHSGFVTVPAMSNRTRLQTQPYNKWWQHINTS